MELEWSFDMWIQIPLYLLNGIAAHLFQIMVICCMCNMYLMQTRFS